METRGVFSPLSLVLGSSSELMCRFAGIADLLGRFTLFAATYRSDSRRGVPVKLTQGTFPHLGSSALHYESYCEFDEKVS